MKKLVLLSLILVSVFYSCKHEILNPVAVPTPVDTTGTGTGTGTGPGGTICFESDILPLFQTGCAKSGCHDATSQREGYILDSYENIMKRGVVPNNANNSKLYKVLFETGEKRMPQAPNPPFTADQIKRIEQWINSGALNSTNCTTTCDTLNVKYSVDIAGIISTNCSSCHSGTASSGAGIILDSYAAASSRANSILLQVSAGTMPKGAARLSDCNIGKIRTWIRNGTLNN